MSGFTWFAQSRIHFAIMDVARARAAALLILLLRWTSHKKPIFPPMPGVYLFKDALGKILYVGKSRSLRNRVKSYFLESRWMDAKTGSLVREIADIEYIVVDNEREALALENSLIKQHKPKFNILLRDDKTYPYIRYTAFEKYPRVYVTRRLVKDGSIYFGPYFPHSLAYRIVHFIHKTFRVPSCTVDLTRAHPRPCLQYYIRRCHGPCVPGLTTDEKYAEAARDTKMFLGGPPRRPDEEPRIAHARGFRLRALRAGRGVPRSAAHAGRDRGAPENRRRRRATTSTCWRGTPSRRWWP